MKTAVRLFPPSHGTQNRRGTYNSESGVPQRCKKIGDPFSVIRNCIAYRGTHF